MSKIDIRRELLYGLYTDGLNQTEIALALRCHRNTVREDFAALGLSNFSEISDDDLLFLLKVIICSTYSHLGRRFINAGLLSFGHRVQRRRVAGLLDRLGHIRGPPRHIRRLNYHSNPGPHFCWHMDQNEHMVGYQIFILTAVDGFTRHGVYSEVITELSGTSHTDFFINAVGSTKVLPDHVCVDKTPCWHAVRHLMTEVFADDPGPTELIIEHRNHPDKKVTVERFKQVKSVNNTVVEIQWKYVNHLTDEYLDCFFDLEADQLLHGGHDADPIDLFCLHTIFLPYIKHDLAMLYGILFRRTREIKTRNPCAPQGSWRPCQLLKMFEHYGTELEDDDVVNLDAIANSYEWTFNPRSDEFIDIQDPLTNDEDRELRDSLMEEAFPVPERPLFRDLSVLREMYIEFRRITLFILEHDDP